MLPITQKKAEKIAIDFLEQYHDASTIESIFIENGIWVVMAKIGLVTPQIRRVLIDASSGRILSYSNGGLDGNHSAKQDQVASVVKKVLLETGQPTYEKVIQKLRDDYNCNIRDCYDYPEYLNNVLKEIFGDRYTVITESIKEQFKDYANQKTFLFFLRKMSK
ncbi:hypothetical protein [Candidatus Nitrosotenuis cloacae]|uniref:hypothetical protein n=1 Tax=Candidatus Nitrosotenuis cloacae TaxID=1603555 RepID=UPI002281BDAA|nr:hypothetical protein [Candidatus Nitrosotenuis cloacae]